MSGFENEFPSNNHKSKEPDPVPEKVVAKVVTNGVVRKKRPLGKRMSEFFITEDPSSVAQYLATEVLLPNIKDLALDLATQGLERMFYGTARSRPRSSVFRTVGNAGFTNYQGMAKSRVVSTRPVLETPRAAAVKQKTRVELDQIMLKTRPEAQEVMDGLASLIEKYQMATIGDLYDLIGETGTNTDEKWGWSNLDGGDIKRVSEGYLLILPPATPIE